MDSPRAGARAKVLANDITCLKISVRVIDIKPPPTVRQAGGPTVALRWAGYEIIGTGGIESLPSRGNGRVVDRVVEDRQQVIYVG